MKYTSFNGNRLLLVHSVAGKRLRGGELRIRESVEGYLEQEVSDGFNCYETHDLV